MQPPDWAAARARMILDPAVAMLNTGSFGPLARPVFDRANTLRLMLAAGPTNFYVRQSPPLLWEARARTAAFLGTVPERFVFTTNVSAAVNLIASGLEIASPGEVLMTDHEYGAMVWCWERAAQCRGLGVRTFALPTMPHSADEIVDAAVRAMTPRTRVLFFSHVLSPTGMVLPAKRLCEAARKRGILTVIDGAHAPAMIPLAVDDIGADFYTGNLHKWLLAPSGAGFLVVGRGNDDRLHPLHVSWGYFAERGLKPDDRDAFGSTPRTRFLEFEGTRDICPWLSVPAAIDFQAELGWDAIRGRIAELAEFTQRAMSDIGLSLATPPGMCGAMTAFELPAGRSAVEWRKELWARRIEIPIIERPGRLLVRVSHHFYTTEAEVDRLVGVVRELW